MGSINGRLRKEWIGSINGRLRKEWIGSEKEIGIRSVQQEMCLQLKRSKYKSKRICNKNK